jgi:hypothetical protein
MKTQLKFYGDTPTTKNQLFVWECTDRKSLAKCLVHFMNENIKIRAAYEVKDGVSTRLFIHTDINRAVFISQYPFVKVQVKKTEQTGFKFISICESLKQGKVVYSRHTDRK